MIDQGIQGREEAMARRSAAGGGAAGGAGESAAGAAMWLLSCHYCGFEIAPAEARVSRCPKCGGGAWEWIPKPGSLLARLGATRGEVLAAASSADGRGTELRVPDELNNVLFRVHCDCSQIYLLLQRNADRLRILALRQTRPGVWKLRLQLSPGQYRYRIYRDDGARLIYEASADVTGLP
jgi:hypothetical protein